MLRFDDATRTLELGVHDLLEAGPPSGHLSMQAAWSARARMRAGQQAHVAWQGARAEADAAFQREVTIRHRCIVAGWEVLVQGRVDGLSQEGEHLVVEEVKSTALPGGRLSTMGADAFPSWTRQLQLYLYFLSAEGRPALGRLVLISLADGFQRLLHVPADPSLGAWLDRQLTWIITEREQRQAWLAVRRAGPVPFAHPDWRPGQQRLSQEVAEALQQGRHLLLTAPTGYGKTAAVLHGALQVAWATDRRVFFATARTTQQRMAEEALRAMAARGLPLRAVSIRAREKICLNEVVACRPDACQHAVGYYDKVRDGRLSERAWALPGAFGQVGADEVVAIAGPATACPFALTLDLVRSADVVVGDYNYVFDPAVRLEPFQEGAGEWIVVVDEAHNLPDRAMGYASPRIDLSMVRQAVDALSTDPRYQGVLDVARAIERWLEGGAEQARQQGGEVALPLDDGLSRAEVRQLAQDVDAVAMDYVLLKHERPLFGQGQLGAGGLDPWLEVARGVLRVRSALERAGEETVCIWRAGPEGQGGGRQRGLFGGGGGDCSLSLLCRDPAPVLRPLFAELAASVQLSATLEPPDFFLDAAGIPAQRRLVARFPSPFPPEHRRVVVLPQVSTEYRHRARDRQATADLVSRTVRAVPGNCAVFCSSFALRDDLLPLLDLGERPVLVQDRRMSEAARAELLATMARGQGHVLLGVLGGIFAEGVDLPGAALLAAVIVGPALPMADLERKLLQQWYQDKTGHGFRYASLVPGMARVVQAAGRVIRTPQDKGAIVLIDQRFLRSEYQGFFPEDWVVRRGRVVEEELAGLWG
ncbi:hypothetical protein L6R53_18015 [Myxococcota bacterium]|nr:hypothetical protein [Myxococcota bacterium]